MEEMGFNAGTFLTDVWFTGSLMPSTLGTSMVSFYFAHFLCIAVALLDPKP